MRLRNLIFWESLLFPYIGFSSIKHKNNKKYRKIEELGEIKSE